jgi:hypothetical protein
MQAHPDERAQVQGHDRQQGARAGQGGARKTHPAALRRLAGAAGRGNAELLDQGAPASLVTLLSAPATWANSRLLTWQAAHPARW